MNNRWTLLPRSVGPRLKWQMICGAVLLASAVTIMLCSAPRAEAEESSDVTLRVIPARDTVAIGEPLVLRVCLINTGACTVRTVCRFAPSYGIVDFKIRPLDGDEFRLGPLRLHTFSWFSDPKHWDPVAPGDSVYETVTLLYCSSRSVSDQNLILSHPGKYSLVGMFDFAGIRLKSDPVEILVMDPPSEQVSAKDLFVSEKTIGYIGSDMTSVPPGVRDVYLEVQSKWPESVYAEYASYYIAAIDHRLGGLDDAIDGFYLYLSKYEAGVYAELADIWLAECLVATGDIGRGYLRVLAGHCGGNTILKNIYMKHDLRWEDHTLLALDTELAYSESLVSLGLYYAADKRVNLALARAVVRNATDTQIDYSIPAGLLQIGRYFQSHTDAAAVFDQMLTIKEGIHGRNAEELLDILIALGDTEVQMGDYEAARRRYVRALAIEDASYGSATLKAGRLLRRTASLHEKDGNYQEAKKLYRKCLYALVDQLGPTHPEVMQCADELQVVCLRITAQAAVDSIQQPRAQVLARAEPHPAGSLAFVGDIPLPERESLLDRIINLHSGRLQVIVGVLVLPLLIWGVFRLIDLRKKRY